MRPYRQNSTVCIKSFYCIPLGRYVVKLKVLKVYALIQYPEINIPWAHSDLKQAAFCLQLSLEKLM